MSSRNNLSLTEALDLLMQEVEIELAVQSYKEVINLSHEAAKQIQIDYKSFFEQLYELLGTAETPGLIERYIPGGEWEELSSRWALTKERVAGASNGSDYYIGLTSYSSPGGTSWLSRGKRGIGRGMNRSKYHHSPPRGKSNVRPFSNYMLDLAKSGNTSRFFGPVTIAYSFEAPDPEVRIGTKMGPKSVDDSSIDTNTIRHIFAQSVKGGSFAKRPDELKMTANIEAFSFLKDVQKTEFAIVDYIIKQIDHAHEKQWVKINGTKGWAGRKGGMGRGHRPIRPIIQPLIQYFINQELPNGLRAIYRSF